MIKKSLSILITLGLFSLALVGWGITMNKSENSEVWLWLFLTATGSSIFGACVGNIIALVNGKKLFRIIKKQAKAKFSSKEQNISEYRKAYHNYWVTLVEGKLSWRYTLLDFSKEKLPGELVSKTLVKSPKDQEITTYKSKAIIRGNRLLLIDEPSEGGQEPLITVFPHFTKTFNKTQYGITLLETHDRVDRIVPMITSIKPIENWTKCGEVDSKTSEVLWDLWKKNFDNMIITSEIESNINKAEIESEPE